MVMAVRFHVYWVDTNTKAPRRDIAVQEHITLSISLSLPFALTLALTEFACD
jgi:hypothetical protein